MTAVLEREAAPERVEPTADDARLAPSTPARPPLAAALSRHRVEILVVIALVLVSASVHAQNMLGFPYFENDEGTYVSRAWRFITTGELDVYTYRYDHAPAGWMFLGAWLGATGGTALFGSLLESGRVFMLVLHTASTVMLYLIARRLSGGMTAGVIAILVFAVSPLGVYFQRRVLLDNMMTFWVLLAILLLLRSRLTLSATVLSGIVFGIAVLTKLNAAFFGLGFLVLLWIRAAPHQRRHALALWLSFAAGTVILLILYALLNEELMTAPLDATGEPEHVSLVDTMALQLGRGDPAFPWDASSDFHQAVQSWWLKDWFTMALAVGCVGGLSLLSVLHRGRRLVALAVLASTLGYIVFLARGGIVVDLYVAPLIPFIGLGTGLTVAALVGWMRPRRLRAALAASAALALVLTYLATTPNRYATVDETTNQEAALDWISANVEPGAVIAADNYAYPALAQEGRLTETLYFFNAEYDPESRALYGNDWRDIDYLVVTHEFVRQVKQGTVPRMREAFDHSELLASYTRGTSSFIDLPNYISTNGDWAQVYRVKDRNAIVLQDTWATFLDTFLHDYGRIASTEVGSITTSADQATGMAQALEQGEEAWFRGIWQWTNDHLRYRANDRMISWQWRTDEEGEGALLSSDTACRTDLGMIGLLAEAGQTWPAADDLAQEARVLAEDWWAGCVFERDGLMLVDSTADGSIDDALLTPSAHDPGLYEKLAGLLPDYDWQRLEDDGYTFWQRVVAARGIVPNWIVLTTDGALASADALVGEDSDAIGGEVLRLVPALLLDELSGDARASSILDALQPHLIEYWQQNRALPSSTTITLLAQARTTELNPRVLYESDIVTAYDPETGSWGDSNSLSDHYWGWAWHRVQDALPESARIPLQ